MNRDWIFRIVPIFIGVIWLITVIAIIGAGYMVATTSAEDVGAVIGRVVHGFNEAKQ